MPRSQRPPPDRARGRARTAVHQPRTGDLATVGIPVTPGCSRLDVAEALASYLGLQHLVATDQYPPFRPTKKWPSRTAWTFRLLGDSGGGPEKKGERRAPQGDERLLRRLLEHPETCRQLPHRRQITLETRGHLDEHARKHAKSTATGELEHLSHGLDVVSNGHRRMRIGAALSWGEAATRRRRPRGHLQLRSTKSSTSSGFDIEPPRVATRRSRRSTVTATPACPSPTTRSTKWCSSRRARSTSPPPVVRLVPV